MLWIFSNQMTPFLANLKCIKRKERGDREGEKEEKKQREEGLSF
jgi:hypothetical protein